MSEPRRPRGRPGPADPTDRRAALLQAARSQFAAKGFAGASLRSIAAEAGVDASLVSHYFGDKQQLLVASLELPVDPLAKLRGVLAGDLEDMGERLVLTFLSSWDPHRAAFATLVRSALDRGDPASAPVLQVAREVVTTSLEERIEGPDAGLRAALIASGVIGLGVMRYVALLEPLASASAPQVALLHGPALQALMDR